MIKKKSEIRSTHQLALQAVTFGLLLLGVCSACGVKGRPQPPLEPPELGRGEPTFKRATEEFRFQNVPEPTPAKPSPTPKSNRSSSGG